MSEKSINQIFSEIYKQLDYKLKSGQERSELLKRVLEDNPDLQGYLDSEGFKSKIHKNQKHFLTENETTGKELEKLANYILMSEDELNKNDLSNHPYVTKSDFNLAKKREVLMTDEELIYYKELEQKAKKRNFKLDNKLKVTDKDREENEYITETTKTINALKKLLDKKCIGLTIEQQKEDTEIRKLKHIIIEIGKDEVDIKRIVDGIIYFKRLLPDTTEYCFDRDTGYVNQKGKYIKLSSNWVKFDIKNHIRGFLKHYDTLHDLVEYDIDSDLKHFLWVLDEYIERCNFDDYLLNILEYKKKGYNSREIAEIINLLYNKDFKDWDIRRLTNETIATRIANEFDRSKKEWLYSKKEDAEYKKCTKCGENKPLNDNFFNFDKANGRFRSQCMECYNKKA